MFEIVIRLYQVHIRDESILHVIHIAGTRMIESGIDGISRGDNLGGMMRGMNPLQLVPLYQGSVVRSDRLELWIRTCWGESLTSIIAKYWF